MHIQLSLAILLVHLKISLKMTLLNDVIIIIITLI